MLAIGSDLDLPAMLRRIIGSAVDLVDATYGALGVLDESLRGSPSSSLLASTRRDTERLATCHKVTAFSVCSSLMPSHCGCPI